MNVIEVCVGAGVCLALWAVLHRKVAEIPRVVWEIVRQERAPAGSAVPLPSEPAMKAAGLGPRPSSRPGPEDAPARRPTLLGIRPPLTPPPPRAPDAEDEDRESSEELTTVGTRPPLSALAATLPSMPAVRPPDAGEGGRS